MKTRINVQKISQQREPFFKYVVFVVLMMLSPFNGALADHPPKSGTPDVSDMAVVLGRDIDKDGDPDEIDIRLEIVEVQEEVYPGEWVTFWVFAPESQGMTSTARLPSPTIRVEEGDRLRITLHNTHYFPHTIHFHGTIHPNAIDGVPEITQAPVKPGESFTYEFIAKNPGTHMYHCHVQTDVHLLMGLIGMFIIEPNEPKNTFNPLVIGAGRIQDLSKDVKKRYTKEYSLVYMDIDSQLNHIPATSNDPREIEKRMHRDYDSTQRKPNIFLLNGRSFPFTLLDTPIEITSGERVKLRILNAGEQTVYLHTHGHHPLITHLDGYPLPSKMRYHRDVFTIGPSQRIDLELQGGDDEKYASGPGVWLMHDHTERAITNKGISPGGDITAIIYEEFMGEDGLPRVATSLDRFFDPDYYKGKLPVVDPAIFHTTHSDYEKGLDTHETENTHHSHPVQKDAATPSLQHDHTLESHQVVATSCAQPRGFRQINMKAGTQFAREGEVYGFEPRIIQAEPCEEVEIVLENTDSVRHALMLPGLNPMFMLEFTGPGVQRGRFVTPDQDITLDIHCHVETHEKMGMHAQLIVGKGGKQKMHIGETTAKKLHEGIGVVVAIQPRKNQIVIDHGEIKGFMAAMVMGFPVKPVTLLKDLQPGDHIRFTIDEEQGAIVKITRIEE